MYSAVDVKLTVLLCVILSMPSVTWASRQCADQPTLDWVGTNDQNRHLRDVAKRKEITIDASGQLLTAGAFQDRDGVPVDLDPTDGVELFWARGDSQESYDIYLTSVDPKRIHAMDFDSR